MAGLPGLKVVAREDSMPLALDRPARSIHAAMDPWRAIWLNIAASDLASGSGVRCCAVLVRHDVPHRRANPRTTIEAVLVAIAMLALLGFQAVVGATLMNHLSCCPTVRARGFLRRAATRRGKAGSRVRRSRSPC